MNRRQNFKKIALFLVLRILFLLVAAKIEPAEKPSIGIFYSNQQYEKLQKLKDPLLPYRTALLQSGASVVELWPSIKPSEFSRRIMNIKGLFIPGGGDFNPKLFGESPHPKIGKVDDSFDTFEIAVSKLLISRKLPIFGICRGLQLLNIVFGGSLNQDIPDQISKYLPEERRVVHKKEATTSGDYPCVHEIQIEKRSILFKLINELSCIVNSYHHQSIRKLGEGLKATAYAKDGTIEAIESVKDDQIFAVQFHPERLALKDPKFNEFFNYFEKKCENFQFEKVR
ncbi:MAG: gamma-glutamyl-gamma-aminobutyrate hydrolase family protein [Candidatus Riflebacteria bacterium]|nr:gamma-glutamyl-gamma-aminobutyrate hydrolase family protein [Candidatus Riflebacteria bacterium]